MENKKINKKLLKKVNMIPVESSNVDFVGLYKYDKHITGHLFVEFNNGGVYQYEHVQKDVFEKLLASESKGRFLHVNIRPFHKVNKIDDIEKAGFKLVYKKKPGKQGAKNENKN